MADLFLFRGNTMAISNISANTIVQGDRPPQLRGQAISAYMLAIRDGLSIGSLATGVRVGVFGV